MTAPRLRQHTDGRQLAVQLRRGPRWYWRVIIWSDDHDAALYAWTASDEEVHGEGWSEAALVALPEPVDVPDSLYPRVAFPSGVKAHHRGDGDCYIAGRVEGYSGPDHARATAVDLLAAALWCEQHEAGETP